MKDTGIHPDYIQDAKVECVCGQKMFVGHTRKDLRVDICSSCHPFFSGNDRMIDSEGMIEKFRKRFNLKQP